jgi:hypothetical protein
MPGSQGRARPVTDATAATLSPGCLDGGHGSVLTSRMRYSPIRLPVGNWAGRSLLVPPQHADGHRPEDAILLAVDQRLGEGATLRVAPELSDPVGPLESGSIRTWRSSAANSPFGPVRRALLPSRAARTRPRASAP